MKNRKKTEVDSESTKTQSVIKNNILELKNITKTFLGGKIIANNNISLSFKRNEIHAIVGENGSGKSTLMNIIFGLYKQDNGDIFVNGNKADMHVPSAAKNFKIGMVHQHFHLVENFTVLENVILGQEEIILSDDIKDQLNERLSVINSELNKLNKNLLIEIEKLLSNLEENEHLYRKYSNIRIEIKKEIKKLDVEKQKNKINKKQLKLENLSKQIDFIKNELDSLNKKIKTFKNKNSKMYFLFDEKLKITNEINSQNFVGPFGILNRKKLLERFNNIQDKYNISLDPYAKVSSLSVGQRQMVEILKVLWEEKDVIVFDEPTATLSVVEIEALLKTINSLKSEGKTIIFISHKLQEVKQIADRISVLKRGVLISTRENTSNLKPSDIGKEMVGKTIKLSYPRREINGKDILKVENLSYRTKKGFKALDDISFSIKEGEIFGIAGIEGNGQEEIIKIITGLRKPSSGKVKFNNDLVTENKFRWNSTKNSQTISHIPIDRYKHGIVKDESLKFNSIISTFNSPFFSKFWKLSLEYDKEVIKLYSLKTKYFKLIIKTFDNFNYENLRKTLLKIYKQEAKVFSMTYGLNTKKYLPKTEKAKKLSKDLELLYSKIDSLQNSNISKYIKELKGITLEIANDKYNKLKQEEFKYKSETLGKGYLLNNSITNEWTNSIIEELKVDGAYNNNVDIGNLSGGNQQKFVIGREILRSHKLLVAGHPTRGLDISAIDHIYKKIIDNSKNASTLLYSLEISELIAVCDRMAILYKGKIIDIIDPKNISMEKISKMLIGEVS